MGLDVLRYPSVCLQLATPHILLGIFGEPDSRFDDLLARSVAACASLGHEVVPYRELEIIWLRSLWRNEIPGRELEEVAHKTALGNPIDLLNGARDDAYAHTHAVMYYTDFGNWRKPLPRPTEEFLAESGAVLARALVIEDYDLAAEALMAWPLTSSSWSSAATFGFRSPHLSRGKGRVSSGRTAGFKAVIGDGWRRKNQTRIGVILPHCIRDGDAVRVVSQAWNGSTIRDCWPAIFERIDRGPASADPQDRRSLGAGI